MRILVMVALVGAFSVGCSTLKETREDWRITTQNPDFIHGAVKQVTDVIVYDIFSPPVASRIYAYMSIAGYEAARHSDPKFQSLAGQVNGLAKTPEPEPNVEYSFSLASTQAMLRVGRTLVFSEDKMDVFYDSIMTNFKNSGMPEDIFQRSVDYGNKVAEHILAWSSKDNYKQSRSFPKYSIEDSPATWKPTPPAYMDAVEPHWNKIRPFAIDSAAQFKPSGPTPFSQQKNSKFYKEAEEVYLMGKSLTEEQREIASFWDCNPFVMNVKGHVMFATKKISPGGHWMNITHVACKGAKKNFVESMEAYTLVSISLVDGFISCWDEKYRSRVIRPESYINQYIDEGWVPLLQTPPFPEYTSGHSVISNASATTLTKLFGRDFAFVDSTEVEFGLAVRKFASFEKAAEEAAISRMYGGIHYRPAVEDGMIEGKALGTYILEKIKTRKEDLAEAGN